MRMCYVGALGLAAALLAGCGEPQPRKSELVRQGNNHYWRGEYAQALGPYTAALDRDHADADLLFQIGLCHFNLRNYRESTKWFRQSLKSFPGHQGAASYLEEAQRRLPDFGPTPASTPATAAGTAPDAPAASPSPRVTAEGYINVARTYERQGDAERALDAYKKAVEAADDQAFTHAALGRYYMRINKSAEALDQLRQAEKLNPNEPGLAEDLARLQAR